MLGSAVLRVPEFVAPKAGQRPENEQILRNRPIGPPERGDHLSTTGPVIKRYLVEEVLRGLHGLGLDATALATRFGLIAARNATAYDNIPLISYLRFFDEAAVRFDHPTLGLEIGSRFRAEQLGPIYPLLLTSETLREALSTLSQFQETLQSETTLQFDPHAPQERFVYHLAGAASGPLRQDVEYVLSSICALIRELIGEDWRPVEVLLAHDARQHIARLGAYFGCAVRGRAQVNAITLTTADLDRPIRSEGAPRNFARPIFEAHLKHLLRPATTRHGSFPEQVAREIAERLGVQDIGLEALASAFDLSPRSFRRRLAEEKTSYGALLQQERRAKAVRLLAENVPLARSASALGYGSQAAFTRAFQAWTGVSPGAVRRLATKIRDS